MSATTPTLKKMKYKEGVDIHIIDLPKDCLPQFDVAFSKKWPDGQSFLLVFVRDSTDIQKILKKLAEVSAISANCWLAYPKKSSKIQSDLSREVIWGLLGTAGLSPVSQISISDDWSALRFKQESEVSHSPTASLDVPNEMLEELKKDKTAITFFYSLSATNRKEYIRWITDAKKKETKEKRLGELNKRLLSGLKNPSEKNS